MAGGDAFHDGCKGFRRGHLSGYHGNQKISFPNARFLCGTFLLDRGYQNTACLMQFQVFGKPLVDILNRNADPGRNHLAVPDQIVYDPLGLVNRYGEPDSLCLCIDGGIDTDQLTVDV